MASDKRLEQFPLLAFFLISFLIGIFCVFFVTDYSNRGAEERLELLHESKIQQLDSDLFDISHGIDVFAESVSFAVKSPHLLKNHEFNEEVNRQIMARLIPVCSGMKGVCNAYLRFNPDICGSGTEGFFLSLGEMGVKRLPVTNISDYNRGDIEHVGWYYIPEEKRVAVWLDPYRNENVGTYMFSYVVPVFSQNVFIGVVGIDIDLTKFIEKIEEFPVFDCGKTFLIDRSGTLLTKYNPEEKKSIVISHQLRNEMVFGMFLPRSSSVFVQNTITFRVIISLYILIIISCVVYIFIKFIKKSDSMNQSINSISQKSMELFFSASMISVLIIQIVFFSHEYFSGRMPPEVTEAALNIYDKTLYVTGDKDFMPYTNLSKTGKSSGFMVELMNVISNRLGYNVQLKLDSRANAFEQVNSGKADIFLGAEVSDSYDDKKLLKTDRVVTDTFEIVGKTGVEGLIYFENKSFAVLKGESNFNLYGIQHESVLFDSYGEVLAAVENGTCDYGYIRWSVANVLLKELNYSDIVPVYNLMNSNLCFALSPTNEKLVGELNAILSQLSASGVIDELFEKWIYFYEKNFSIYEIFRDNAVFFLISVVLFLLCGILTMFMHLKRQNTEGEKFSKNLLVQLEALSRSYVSMYLFDMEDDTYQEYKNRRNSKGSFYSQEKARGAKEFMPLIIKQTVSPAYLDAMLEFTDLGTLQNRIRGKGSIEMEFIGSFAGWCRGRFISLSLDEDGESRFIIWAVETIDEEKKREIELKHRSEIDLLTGINNRGSGEARIRSLMANGKNGMFMLFDIDKFKTINDSFGHNVGDKVLIEVAKAMRDSFRDNDVIVRFGGDEFVAYAVGALSESSAKMIFDRLFDQIEHINIPELGSRKIAISVGASFFTEDSEKTFDVIYKQADECTYSSKAVNGNFYTFYREKN